MLSRKHFVMLSAVAISLVAVLAFENGNIAPINASHAVPAQPQAVQAGRALPDFSTLVDQAGPAVVNISVVRNIRTAGPSVPGVDRNDPFYEFFRRFQGPAPEAAPPQGVGSGFIVSPDGYILTNAHVVADASEVMVKITDKREFKAKVIGVDRRTDVALIKIDGNGLPTVKIGNSSQSRVGEWVAAIGSPFGFENSVTAGIISAKARALPDESYVPFLQTDVAVNPGNSGGPLLNVNGEVIGINSQIYSRSGGYMGLSFAIPIEVAMKVKDELQKFGKVSRGRLGVSVQALGQELADSFGLKASQGALVNSVDSDGPAAAAGVAPGDVILAVNDAAISLPADLVRSIGDARPGQSVTLKVWRKGTVREIAARLTDVIPEKTAAAESDTKLSGGLGLKVRPLTAEEQKQAGTTGGLLVETVTGSAARAGIAPGDIIIAVNNEQIKSAEQMKRLANNSRGNVAVLVQRENQRIYLPLRIG